MLGAIAGAGLLAAGLWATGNLRVLGPGFTVWQKPVVVEEAPEPAPLPDLSAANQLKPPPLPPDFGAPESGPSGQAGRTAPKASAR